MHKFLNVRRLHLFHFAIHLTGVTVMISQVNDFLRKNIIKIATINPEYFVDVWLLSSYTTSVHHTFRSVKTSRGAEFLAKTEELHDPRARKSSSSSYNWSYCGASEKNTHSRRRAQNNYQRTERNNTNAMRETQQAINNNWL